MWDQNEQDNDLLGAKPNLEAPLPTTHSEIVADINKIDKSLKNDYKCYLWWLWADFFINVGWAVNLFLVVFGVGSKVYSVWVSVPTTILILITIAYGISGFNAKDGARQYKFTALLKVLIVVFIINAIVLLATQSILMLLGRLMTIFVSIALLYYGKDLEKSFRRRRRLLEMDDRLSVDARFNV